MVMGEWGPVVDPGVQIDATWAIITSEGRGRLVRAMK